MKYEMEEMLFLATFLSGIKPIDLLKQLLAKSISPILVTDRGAIGHGHKIIYANKGFCELSGYELAELVGRSPSIFKGPKSNREALARLPVDLVETGYFRGASFNYRKDGSCYPMEWDISPIFDEQDNIIYFISFIRDLTPTLEKAKQDKLFNEKVRRLILKMGQGQPGRAEMENDARPVIEELKTQAVQISDSLSEIDDEWGDSLFDLDSNEANASHTKSAISASDYLQNNECFTEQELLNLVECIKDIEDEINTLSSNPSALYVLDEIKNKLNQLSTTIFFLVEFTDVALALTRVADCLPNMTEKQLAGFGIEFLQSMIVEVDNWVEAVFISHSAMNIYEGADMIIAAANQISTMCTQSR